MEKDRLIITIPSKGFYVADYDSAVLRESRMRVVESKLQVLHVESSREA